MTAISKNVYFDVLDDILYVINCMLNGKDLTIHLKVGLLKRTLYNNQ